jgi:hypothetical protein
MIKKQIEPADVFFTATVSLFLLIFVAVPMVAVCAFALFLLLPI